MLILCLCAMFPLFRKSTRLQREEKASNGKQQAGKELMLHFIQHANLICIILLLFFCLFVCLFGGFIPLIRSKHFLLAPQIFQTKWRDRPLPRGAALIYREGMWRRKKRIVLFDAVPESQDTNWTPVISLCSMTVLSPSEFSSVCPDVDQLLRLMQIYQINWHQNGL